MLFPQVLKVSNMNLHIKLTKKKTGKVRVESEQQSLGII